MGVAQRTPEVTANKFNLFKNIFLLELSRKPHSLRETYDNNKSYLLFFVRYCKVVKEKQVLFCHPVGIRCLTPFPTEKTVEVESAS